MKAKNKAKARNNARNKVKSRNNARTDNECHSR